MTQSQKIYCFADETGSSPGDPFFAIGLAATDQRRNKVEAALEIVWLFLNLSL